MSSIMKSSAVIASLTMLSRIFGFLRDMLIANFLGASWLSDAFFVAFKLPNFFRKLFAEGAFNAAFVPQFAGLLETQTLRDACRFAGQALAFLLIALLALNALFLAAMPWVMAVFAPGFLDHPEQFATTVTLARICFPYILFISLVSLLGAMLNATGRFAAVAATPVLLNLCLISAMYLIGDRAETMAHALSYGVFTAGVIQLIWLLIFCRNYDCLPTLGRPRLTPQMRHFFLLIAPAALGAGVAQINLLIDVILASLFPEGVSYLYYADRLNELPIGVIGVAVGTVLLPMLSRQIKSGNRDAARHSLNRAIELVLLFALPAMVAFLVIPQALIALLYEHGAFTPEDTRATYHALMAYAMGLPAFVLVKVLAPGFFANEDTKTPFKIALVCVLVNLVCNLILMQFFAHVGLAMATSISGWLNASLMAWILYRREVLRLDARCKRRVLGTALCALAMGAMLWVVRGYTHAFIEWVGVVMLIISGAGVYGLLLMASRTFTLQDLKASLAKK